MRPYEYPRVPRSSNSQPQLSVETGRSNARDSTFSWVDTPAEAETRLSQRQSEAPPLPQVSDTLNAQPLHNQEAPAYVSREELPQEEPVEFEEDMKHKHNKPDPTPCHEVQAVQYAATTTDPRQQYQHQYQYEQPPPDPPKSHSPTHPQPVHYTITPDTNPLHTPHTPTTPTLPRTQTTNMTILPPPTSPSHFPVSSYTPTPQPSRGGTFTTSLFSCASPSICLPSLFCPCIIYGRTQYRLSQRSAHKDPTNMLGYSSVNGSCVAFGVLCGINGVLAAIQHTRVRKAYDMDGEAGNVAGDCVKGCCCCCCVVAQDEREVKMREEEVRKVGGGKEGYVPPSSMVFGVAPR